MEATPLNNGLSGCGLSLTARGHRERSSKTRLTRELVDKETELGLVQDCRPLSKVEIQAEIAQLQKKSGRGCPLLEVILP